MSSTRDGDGQRYQNVVVMRHGDRLDNFEPLWAVTAERKWDPPLVEAGKTRAFGAGRKFRQNLGFSIDRVFVSPFLRCLETAAQVVSALCAENLDPTRMSSHEVAIDPTKIKVSIEYGLCEMLNSIAIRPQAAPEDGDFPFNISECEAILPAGTVDHSPKRVYETLPRWEETVASARDRYVQVIKALADKYPLENLLLITHGEGVGVSVSAFAEDITIYAVEYCGYTQSRRSICFGKDDKFTAGNFEAILDEDQMGISYYSSSSDVMENELQCN